MSKDVVIRPFEASDWLSIWPIIREVVAAGDTYTYPAELDEELARQLWLERPPGLTVVAVSATGVVIGTAKMGPNHRGPGSHVATASFMVAPTARGLGVGRVLGRAALDWARSSGFRAMQFNAVVESNLAAVALWRSLGFDVVGTVPEAFAHPSLGLVGLHIMHQRL